MKLTLLKAAAVASVLVFNTAYADSIQVDLNADSTLTGAFDQFLVGYDSHTVVNTNTGAVHTYAGAALVGNDILGQGVIYTDFDAMTSSGGVNTLASNPNTNLLLTEEYHSGNFPAIDTYLSFGVDLMGTFSPTNGIVYTSGTLDLWQGYTDGTPAEKILTSTFISGGITAGNQDVLSLASAPDILKSGVLFFNQNGTPVSFSDYLATNPLEQIRLTIDQNVQNGASSVIAAVGGSVADGFKFADANTGEVYVSAQHNASLQFAVPEPTTLAILGLGLLGFAGSRRRNS